MPRRYIFTIEEIYKRRGTAWKFHYENRALAREMTKASWDNIKILQALAMNLPEPELQIDGWMLEYPLNIRHEHFNNMQNHFRLPNENLLCIWYWTESNWQEFKEKYQALPEVYEDYYLKYDPEPNDRGLLVPMSSKPKQGSKKVLLSTKPVDNPL